MTQTSGRQRSGIRPWVWPVAGVALVGMGLLGWQLFGPTRDADAAQTPKKPAPKKKTDAKTKTAKPAKKPAPIPLERQPYRVRVSVAFANSTALLPGYRKSVLSDLRQLIVRGYGSVWNAEVVENTWIAPASDVGLNRLAPDALLERFPGAKPGKITGFDKVIYVAVEADGPRIRMSAREWDARSQRIGPLERRATFQRRDVARQALLLLSDVFRPTLMVESFDGWDVEFKIQAGAFRTPDESLRQVKVGDVILPYFRYLDRPKIVRRIQSFDWTYVIVDQVSDSHAAGSLVSAYFRNPLGTGRRRRVDIYAQRVRIRMPESRLKMVYQTDETKPLIGYNIHLVWKRYPRDEADKPPEKQFSGRDGFVTVKVDKKQPVAWVYVYSGTALLARVPYVPGLSSEETVALPDDSIRLAVEGQLDLLQGRLIDVVARRATLMALAQKAYDDKKLTKAERDKKVAEKFKQIDELPGISQFEADLNAIREPAVGAATRLGNRFAVIRIRRMATRVEKLIKRHLDMGPVEKFRDGLGKQ